MQRVNSALQVTVHPTLRITRLMPRRLGQPATTTRAQRVVVYEQIEPSGTSNVSVAAQIQEPLATGRIFVFHSL